MTVDEPAVHETAALTRGARKLVLPRPWLLIALIALIPLAIYLWMRPALQEKQLQRATLPELQARAKTQEDSRTLYYLGLRLREKGEREAAYAAWKRAATLNVSDEDLWLALADSAGTIEGVPAAFDTLTAFVKNNRRSAPGHLALARLYMERRSYRRAREEAKAALAFDATLAEAWRIAGQAALAMELAGDAAPDLRKAIALDPKDWQSQAALGDALAAANRFPDSIPVYQEAVRLAPDEPIPPLSLGRALMKAFPVNAPPGQLESARQSIERSIALRGDIAVAHLLLGQCLARQNKLPEAQAALERARDLAPADPDAYFELSRVAAKRGDRAAAAKFRAQHDTVQTRRNAFGDRKRLLLAKLDNAMQAKDAAKADALRRELAQFLAEGGEPTEALQQYTLLLTLNPDDATLQRQATALRQQMQEAALAQMPLPQLLATGDSLFQRRQYPDAANVYRAALRRDARNAAAAEGLGLALEAEGRAEDATYFLLAATRLDSKRPRAEFALGIRYQYIGFLTEAQKRLARVVELEPENAAAWRSLGEILRDKEGGEAEAETAFQKAADLEPKNASYLLDFADTLDTNNKKDKAEEIFRKALTLAPDSAEANASLGAFLVNSPAGAASVARREEAERLLQRALEIDPADDFARYYQGKLALDKGDAARAILLLEAVLKNGPNADSREIWYALSRAYTKSGQAEKARKAMETSHNLEMEGIAYTQARERVSLRPNDPETHVIFARVLVGRGENARAITEYERALRLNPQHSVSQKELAALKSRLQASGQMPSMSLYRALTAPDAPGGIKSKSGAP